MTKIITLKAINMPKLKDTAQRVIKKEAVDSTTVLQKQY